MFRETELIKLKENIDTFLCLAQKKDFIIKKAFNSFEIIGNKIIKGKDFNNAGNELLEINKELRVFLYSLPRSELYNLQIAFDFGKLKVLDYNHPYIEYLKQLDNVKEIDIINNEFFLRKFIDTDYEILKDFLNKGLIYMKSFFDIRGIN